MQAPTYCSLANSHQEGLDHISRLARQAASQTLTLEQYHETCQHATNHHKIVIPLPRGDNGISTIGYYHLLFPTIHPGLLKHDYLPLKRAIKPISHAF